MENNYEVICEAENELGETLEVRLFPDGHVEIITVPKEKDNLDE